MALPTQGKAGRTRSAYVSCTLRETPYTLYTCPQNCTAEVSMMLVTGVLGSVTFDVTWNISAGSDHCHIIGGKGLSVGEFVLLTGATLILQPGDTLAILIDAGGGGSVHVDVSCTVTETFVPVG